MMLPLGCLHRMIEIALLPIRPARHLFIGGFETRIQVVFHYSLQNYRLAARNPKRHSLGRFNIGNRDCRCFRSCIPVGAVVKRDGNAH
jgi:hypothetical protein